MPPSLRVMIGTFATLMAFSLLESSSQTPIAKRLVGPGAPAEDLGLQMRAALREPLPQRDLPLFEPDRVIVKFRSDVASGEQHRVAQAFGARVFRSEALGGFALLSLDRGSGVLEAVEALNASPQVEYAQPSYLRQALDVPNDPLFADQWNLTLLRMPRAWDINPGASSTVVVAVVDTGVAFQNATYEFDAPAFRIGSLFYRALGHIAVPFAAAPELDGSGRWVDPWDFVWNDRDPVDMEGHGTHVAGTVGENTNNLAGVAGVAFNVRIMPVKVVAGTWDFIFGAADGEGATDFDLALGILYAASHGARVINVSVGGPGGAAPVLEDAIRTAVAAGSVVVMAAGNDFEEGNRPNYPAALGARIDGAIAVGAVGRDARRASYSNTSSSIELSAPGGDQRRDGIRGGVLQQKTDDLVALTYERGPTLYTAPRFNVMVYDYLQGTSMAAPHVSGFAALLISQGITHPAAVEAAMKRFAQDLGPKGVDSEYGYGLIDPVSTLRGLGLGR